MNRAGFKWTVNEILSLQREFELLGMTIDEIALKHQRTPNAIMFKLDQEGFADYNVLYSNYHDLNARVPVLKSDDLSLDYNDSEDDNEDSELDDCDEVYIDEDEDEDEDDEVVDISERVYGLEESVSEIRDMVKQMMTMFSKQSSCKSWF
jgi:hypothetical protein